MPHLPVDRREAAQGFATTSELARLVCDEAAVMQGGRIVETLPAATLRERAAHPYTKTLMAARLPSPAPEDGGRR